ncbi:hypothetical protein RA27_20395 [Ruegeria sp. ANG-R]|uniref:winged helix DNA-binding protein n=1 Tax=Ruegeria sp. ANG-R TaxID=1577903 RepID=UPI00057F7C2C|nr:winged helix DNA-binding protein [Ruegeria sp. ANG-R]KIC38133.1 hypothetical protein RA27_20395 [Ruegeria sp. ANG-R]
MSGGAHQTMLLHHLGNTCKTIEVLTEDLGLDRRQISNAATALIRKDYLERVELGCFQLTEFGRAAAQRGEQITSGPNGAHEKLRRALPNTLRQRAWSAIRIQRRFTVQDILTAAATGAEVSAHNNLQRYFKALCDGGVLRRLPKRQAGSAPTSNGFAQYTLVRDLGHIAPSYRAKAGSLIDHNTGEEIAA